MAKTTLEVLAVKIDALHEDIKDIKKENAENTKFRLQAKGAMATVGVVFGVIGGVLTLLFQKFIGLFSR